MDDKCLLDPNRDCFGLIKAREIEQDLNELRKQNASTHERIFDKLNEMGKKDAVQEEKYNHFLEKMMTLTDKIEHLTNRLSVIEAKPAKKWEGMVEKVIGAVILAIAGFFLGRLGL